MQDAFISKFFATEREISLTDLALVRQRNGEPVEKFIDRWGTTAAQCRELPSEGEQMKMCLRALDPMISYGLSGNTFSSFRELATKAHLVEEAASRVNFRPERQKRETGRVVETHQVDKVKEQKDRKCPAVDHRTEMKTAVT